MYSILKAAISLPYLQAVSWSHNIVSKIWGNHLSLVNHKAVQEAVSGSCCKFIWIVEFIMVYDIPFSLGDTVKIPALKQRIWKLWKISGARGAVNTQ